MALRTPEELHKLEQEIVEEIENQLGCETIHAMVIWADEKRAFLAALTGAPAMKVLDMLEQYAGDDHWDGGKTPQQFYKYVQADRELRARLCRLVMDLRS